MGESCIRPYVSVAICFLLVLVLTSCAPPSEPAEKTVRPTRGYILISLDTLRADHLGCYGYDRNTSPFLDSLAEKSVLFENAIVQYPSTLTSHMSMFTGLYPAEHGVYPPDSVLSTEIETLPEAFQAAGFRTAGFTEGGYVHGRFGFRRGFDVFQSRDQKPGEDAQRVFRRGLRFLDSLENDRPFFLFLHTYAVHAPYEPNEHYRKMFWEGDPPADAFPPTGPELVRHNALGKTLSPTVLDYFTALYDAEIRHLDEILAGFFSELQSLGLAHDTTVIITSDHGEEFQDHGKMNHAQLYREVLHVPLLVHHPDFDRPARHTPPVRTVDLAPTFHELARLEPRTPPSGSSLVKNFHSAADAPGSADETNMPTEAYAEIAGGIRSLVRQDGDQLNHLLVFQPSAGRWWTRKMRLGVESGTPIQFEVRSYQQPRTFEVHSGETLLHTSEIGTEWTTFELPALPAQAGHSGPRALTFSSPDCTVQDDSAKKNAGLKKVRCYSFQVRGIPLARAELYDVVTDPAEVIDLSARDGKTVRSLYALLEQYQRRSAAKSQTRELDDKLRSELEALGYLQ